MSENRINEQTKQLERANVDSIFITSKENVFYFSNYYTDPHERLVAVYISQQHDPLLILPTMELEDAKSAGWKKDIIHYGDHENPWEKFYDFLQSKQALPETIGLEYNDLSLSRYKKLKQLFPKVKMTDFEEQLSAQRVIKSDEEFAHLQEAARLADYGVEVGKNAITLGASELEIIAEIEYALKKKGVQEMSFSTMVLTGAKTASPHGTPSTDKVANGDFVLFDLGVIHNGYCSDITRTFGVGDISKEQRTIYETVLRAEKAAIEAAQLGTEVGTVDKTAREIITEAGYGEYFTHRIGHGLGIDVHEFPSMHQDNTLPLEKGMCFTIEPGIYVPNVGGVRIEDMIFMTEDGPKSLTQFPKDLQIISK